MQKDKTRASRKNMWLGATTVSAFVILIELLWLYDALPHLPERPIGPVAAANDEDGGWFVHSGEGGRRYSRLAQITPANVRGLKVAWTYSTGDLAKTKAAGTQGAHSLQMTPIIAADNLIGCTKNMEVFALDPETGVQRWRFDAKMVHSQYGAVFSKCRGVVAWTDPQLASDAPCKTRIVFGANMDLYALDARNGHLCQGFGNGGRETVPVEKKPAFVDELQLRSPGVVINDTVIFGTTFIEDYRIDQPSGKVRAFDLRSGKLRWDFDPIPRDPADPSYATWGGNSAKFMGGGYVWTFISVDPKNNLVFLPTSAPSAEYYGGRRPGNNEWSTSLVALDATTGKKRWAFQTTHHDVFDYDLPAQPILVDIKKGGRTVPAVVQLTKQGFIFVFDRLTGRPIHPVHERPVPQNTDVPGEVLAKTQPFAEGMPVLGPTRLRPEDAWGFTPIDKGRCRRLIESHVNEGIYTPPTLKGSVWLPSLAGGPNWGGAAIDERTNVMVVPTMNLPLLLTLVPRGKPLPAGTGAHGPFRQEMLGTPYTLDTQILVSQWGVPCSPPPWSKLTAIDLNTGKVKWDVPLGTIENLSRFAPPLMLGSPITGGPLMTSSGIVFMAGGTDNKIRAFDLKDGKIMWTGRLPAPGMAAPVTYSVKGKQFVVIAAGGNNVVPVPIGDSVVAFSLY